MSNNLTQIYLQIWQTIQIKVIKKENKPSNFNKQNDKNHKHLLQVQSADKTINIKLKLINSIIALDQFEVNLFTSLSLRYYQAGFSQS